MGIIPDENSQVYIIQRKVLKKKKSSTLPFFLTAKSIGKQKVSPTLPFFSGAPPFLLFFSPERRYMPRWTEHCFFAF